MPGKRPRILIVEDELITRRILSQILSQIGDCDVASNGNEAVNSFRAAWEEQNSYDLICMDIMMPEMDGHQALSRIRDMEKNLGISESDGVNVIIISALDDPKNVVKAFMKGGASSYLAKPVIKEKLFKKIQDMGFIIPSMASRGKSITI